LEDLRKAVPLLYLRTDGSPAQLNAAAMALAQLPVNVIVAFGTPPHRLDFGLPHNSVRVTADGTHPSLVNRQ
jgi:hypothetical protein